MIKKFAAILLIGMASPYQILDWYGGDWYGYRHICHTASGAPESFAKWKLTVCPAVTHGGRFEHIRRLSRRVAAHVVGRCPLTGNRRRCLSRTPSLPHVLLHADQSDQSLYSQPSCSSTSSASPAAAATNIHRPHHYCHCWV